jgi:hypothetical protein
MLRVTNFIYWLIGVAALIGIVSAVSQAHFPRGAAPMVKQVGGHIQKSCTMVWSRVENGDKFCTCLQEAFVSETNRNSGRLFSAAELGTKEFERRIQNQCMHHLR